MNELPHLSSPVLTFSSPIKTLISHFLTSPLYEVRSEVRSEFVAREGELPHSPVPHLEPDMTQTNLKPADELLTIRQRIKALQAREAEIKEAMISGGAELAGDFAIAELKERAASRFDRKAAEAELGDLSRFENKTTQTVLIITELEGVLE